MASGPIDHAAAATPTASSHADPQLFAVQPAGLRRLPDQRQTGTARRGQRIHPRPGEGRRSDRRRRTAGDVLPHRQRRRRSSCCPPAWAPPRCSRCCMRSPRPDRRARSGGCTAPATAPSIPSRRRAAHCSIGCPTADSHIFYSRPSVRRSAGRRLHRPTGGCRSKRSATSACLATRTPTCAARRRSWPISVPASRPTVWIRARIHTEIFGAAAALTPGIAATSVPPHLPAGPPGPGPEVQFARSAIVGAVGSADASLLEFAEACDVPTRWSCRTGVCHNCETALLSGTVRYDPRAAGTARAGKHPDLLRATHRGGGPRPLSAAPG